MPEELRSRAVVDLLTILLPGADHARTEVERGQGATHPRHDPLARLPQPADNPLPGSTGAGLP